MRALGLLLALLPGAALAEALIDYDLLFQTHASEVVQTDRGARLDLPGGVTVQRTEDGSYIGTDTSGNGAVGCLFLIMEELRPLVTQCEGLVPETGRAQFDQNDATLLDFLAANAVPPRSAEALRASLSQAPVDPAICAEAAAPDSDISIFLTHLTSPESADDLAKTLAVPRLPVTNPCL
ncbi:hypothetical protein [Stagnihabitans tardus]|uniref:Uncharacterized protein n=1 Tax=Stagnihabitans tardus TaxID=2699202 RepID=A0AAE4YBN3_9RHOB|nr:hypothetical protein [Stagnihabitans tardus]NBZ89623.1 hypothetical protein [Stagnihabitans tardus]